MHHQQHAEEARDDREHAMPADPLAEQRPGEPRDQERREEEDGDGLVELEISEREKVETRRHHHQRRAKNLNHRFRRTERGRECQRPQHHGAEHDMADEAEP